MVSITASRFRPAYLLAIMLALLAIFAMNLLYFGRQVAVRQTEALMTNQALVRGLGLSDLCLSTEARYTRHLAASDRVVVSMDHPGGIDHFPSSTFFHRVP